MRKRIEISTIVCAMLLLLGSGGCGPVKDHPCKDNNICVPEASCVPNATTGENWCTKWESPLTILPYVWTDAKVGNTYEVDFEADGGFTPYHWQLSGDYPSWLTIDYDGDGKTAKLQSTGVPLIGDMDTNGRQITITVFDESIPGKDMSRADNKGVSVTETFKVTGCSTDLNNPNNCLDCNSVSNPCQTYGAASCNGETISKCVFTGKSCLVLQDQTTSACNGHGYCTTIAEDGTVKCNCNNGWEGDNCGCDLESDAVFCSRQGKCGIFSGTDKCGQARNNVDCGQSQCTGYDTCGGGVTSNVCGCTPNCTNKNCGDDGCGGSCPNMCTSPATCGGGTPSTLNQCGYLSLVLVLGGTFNRDATYTSTVSSAFHMSETEITRDQFNAVMGFDPSDKTYSSSATSTTDPVQNVNWYHALVFCNKLSKAENLKQVYSIQVNGVADTNPDDWGPVPTAANDPTWDKVEADWTANGYRLPTEMEWMWAAMGATSGGDTVGTTGYTKAFAGSTGTSTNGIDNYAWIHDDSNGTSHPVRNKDANELGLYDMSGNVWEWCWDWYGTYPSENRVDYTGAASGPIRVLRGGSWSFFASYAAVAFRYFYSPNSQYYYFGFRVVRP